MLFFAWFAKGVCWIIIHLPLVVRQGLGDLLGLLWFDVFRIRRQIIDDNLKRAFPDMKPAERTQLGRVSLRLMGRNFLDYSLLPFFTPQRVAQLIEFYGMENLDLALQQGRGVLLLTLHMGHGDLASAALSVKGYKIVMVSKFFKIQWLNRLWFGMREKLGTEFVAARNSSYAILKALKKGKIVIFPLDQFTGPPIGARTKFFAHETGTALGMSMMAERSLAPVVAAYTIRTSNGHHQIYMDQIVESVGASDPDQSRVLTTQRYNDVLEQFVRRHPEQWMWIHRRWKRFVVQ